MSILFRFFSFFGFKKKLSKLADNHGDLNPRGRWGTMTCDGDGDGNDGQNSKQRWGPGVCPHTRWS